MSHEQAPNPLFNGQEARKLHHPPLRPLNLPDGFTLPKGFVEYDPYPKRNQKEDFHHMSVEGARTGTDG